MKTTLCIVGLPILLLAGCATNTPPESMTSLTNELSSLQQSENVNKYAPVELQAAERQVENATKAWDDGDEVEFNHEAYLAQQKVEITKKQAELGDIQKQLESATQRRSELMLSARDQKIQSTEQQLSQLQSQVKDAKAENTDRGIVLTLQDMLFEFDKAQLEPGGERTVDRLAQFLNDNPDTNITIEGYTDSQGKASYNKQLSRKRAEAVLNELEKLNVARERISIEAYGEQFPIASNKEAAGRQQNRRVEVVLSKPDQDYTPPSR